MKITFEEKAIITDAVNTLFEISKTIDRGGYLTNDQITAVTGCAPQMGHWSQTIKRLRSRILKERGITIWPEPGVGQRFLTVHETLTFVPKERQRRALKHIRKGADSVASLPNAELDVHQRRVRALRVEVMKQTTKDILSGMKQDAVLFKKTETMPLRRRNAPSAPTADPSQSASR